MKKTRWRLRKECPYKVLVKTKLIVILLAVAALQVNANGYAQNTVSLSERNSSLIKVFKQIKKQTGFSYILTSDLLSQAGKISIECRNVSLTDALDIIFRDQPQLTYTIVGKTIVVKEREEDKTKRSESAMTTDPVRGRVTDEDGQPIAGANVAVKGTNKIVTTDNNGEYILTNVNENAVIEISFVGYEKKTFVVKGGAVINAALPISTKELDVAVVQAYGATTRRLMTGNISKVDAADLSKQPVTNPLAAIAGRVPGVVINQSSGVPGSAFSIEIRGRSSLDLKYSRNEPLFVIDGVPFESGNVASSRISSAANNPTSTSEGGMSPLNFINISDIESIEILKDADATAIYGSRGANGIVLITTKRAKVGKTHFSANLYTGLSNVTRTMDMLNTQEYVQMRKEAFQNSLSTPNATNAPDIVSWDTTRYTDFKKFLTGNTATSTDAQMSLSGGSSNTKFLIGTGFHKETTVYPGDFAYKRSTVHVNLNHSSIDNRFRINLSALYSSENNNLMLLDLTRFINVPPNLLLYDNAGNLSWSENGVLYSSFNNLINPLSYLLRKYTYKSENLSSNFTASYKLSKFLSIKSSFGYNTNRTDEIGLVPKSSIDPSTGETPSSSFANGYLKSWIIEPQVDYLAPLLGGNLNILLGSTFQERTFTGVFVNATNYTNDLLLNSIAAAGLVKTTNDYSQYRYNAFFGRINYNFQNKYLINFSGRRDGSSRFGPEKQYANFQAVGLGWIFTNENFLKNSTSFLSFGKLRGSYGVTGNDQIGDYKFLNLWANTFNQYQGVPGLYPTSLFNPDYNWERSQKSELGIDLGFNQDKILFSGSYYRNKNSNQLISYPLPTQTGFTNVIANLPAVVLNSGVELYLSVKNKFDKLTLQNSFTLTVPKNKLISFPGLESTSYSQNYVIGKSLTTILRYKYLGVDPAKGIYTYEDVNKDNQLNSKDYQELGNTDPKFYGSWQSVVNYKKFELSIHCEFRNQVGKNYLYALYNTRPGTGNNQPVLVQNRWRKPGDVTDIQRYVSGPDASGAFGAAGNLTFSNAIYSNASYIRLKNLSLSYSFDNTLNNKLHITNCRFFIQAQNLLTLTDYIGSDPETQNFYQLPPLRTIAVGFNLTL